MYAQGGSCARFITVEEETTWAVNASKTRRLPRRLLPFALVALLLALTPLSLLAANPFTDLVSDSVHNPKYGV